MYKIAVLLQPFWGLVYCMCCKYVCGGEEYFYFLLWGHLLEFHWLVSLGRAGQA